MGYGYLPPTSDSVFKALFGNQRKKEFILSFLSSFLVLPNDELFDVKFLDPLFPIECKHWKYCTLDLLVETKSGHKINVEMQNIDLDGFDKRVAYYLSRLAAKQLSQADDYDLLNRSIVIFILNYKMKPEKFNNSFTYFDNCLSNWRLRNEKGEDLTDVLEVNIIELPKVPIDYDHNFFYDWLNFIKAKKKEEFEMIEQKTECKELKDAVVTLRQLSGDELQQAIYEAELDSLRVQNASIKTAKREALAEGLKKGIARGIKRGMKEGKKEGIKEGEMRKTIENVINLIMATDMSLKKAMRILKVDENYKRQIIAELNKLDIKYSD